MRDKSNGYNSCVNKLGKAKSRLPNYLPKKWLYYVILLNSNCPHTKLSAEVQLNSVGPSFEISHFSDLMMSIAIS